MDGPPAQLDGADVLCWVASGRGGFYQLAGSDLPVTVVGMADADHKGGWLRTPPVVFRGNRLRLNIDTGSAGAAFIELQDGNGKAIPRFALADCEEIGGNFIGQSVYQKGKADVSSLDGKPVRLLIKMKRTKLFVFQFTKD